LDAFAEVLGVFLAYVVMKNRPIIRR
jgi:hypothetical protein